MWHSHKTTYKCALACLPSRSISQMVIKVTHEMIFILQFLLIGNFCTKSSMYYCTSMKSFLDLLQDGQRYRHYQVLVHTSTQYILPSILRYYYGKRGSKHSRESLSDNMINVPQLLISWLYGFNEINHCVLVTTTAACCLPFQNHFPRH